MVARFTSHSLAISLIVLLCAVGDSAWAQCNGLGSINFTVVEAPEPTLDFPTGICNGQQATIVVNEPFASYLWSSGGTSSSITVNQAGIYTVTVTNSAGCEGTASAVVVPNPAPAPAITGNTTICPGGSTVLSLTQSYPDILWSSGQNTQDITVSSLGNYTVTVTAANGCTASSSIVVTPGSSFFPPFTALPSGCGQFALEVGPGYASYLWSTGSMGQSILVTQTGDYSVTVTDASSCTGTVSLTVVIPPPPVVQINGAQSICTGGTVNLTASPGFINYSWSNGVNSANNAVNQPGNYSVTATDASGCTATATVNVNALPDPVPLLSLPAPICSGETATISVTNPNFQNYNWSNGGSGSSITVSSAGAYTVTVTDAAGCTGTDVSSLTVNPSPSIAVSQLPYQCNGQAQLSATPGFPTYAWSNGESIPNITVNQGGSYTVTITGANGCTSTANVNAVIPPDPQVVITGDADICDGTNTTLLATSGFSNYLWNTGQGGSSISVNSTGTYFVTVTNAFSCTATNSFNVTVQSVPEPQITGPTQICSGGTAVFTATGGPFANYLWSNGGQSSTISVSNAGSYGLTVTAANGCTGTASVGLTVGNSLNISLIELPYQCNGQMVLDAGAGFQTYSWSTGGNQQLETVNSSGSFTVTVTDATGCAGEATTFVNIPAPPQGTISGPNQICEGESADLTASAGFANYLWSNGQQNPGIAATTSGTYAVTLTDFDGCQTTASFSLAVNPIPQPVITGASTICQNSSTLLSAAGSYQDWSWSSGQTTPEITVSAAGDYVVTVTGANGCTGTDVFQLNVSTSLQPQISAQPYTCNGQVTLDAGVGFLTYTWSNGGASQTIPVSQNGNYEVTVSDASGCTGTAVFNANIPVQPSVAIAGGPAFCTGGSSVLTAAAGFQNYLWSDGTLIAETTVTQPGTYTVTATDANGCTSVAALAVVENALPQPQILGGTTLCNGASTTLSVSASFPTLLWSTGETAPQITVSSAGTIGLQVIDANGCSGLDSVVVITASSLSPQINAQPYTCNGQLTLDAGVGFLTYTWSNGGASQTIPVSQNGNYEVTVSDASGCTGTAVFNANIPLQPSVAITGGPAFCSGGSSALTAAAGFQNYLWSDGTLIAETTVTQPGTYTVTATDANGCTSVAALTVVENTLPQPQILGGTTLCNGASTTLSVSASFPTLLWSTGETTPQITVSSAGTLGLLVIDANGCSGSASVEVIAGSLLSPQITAQPYTCNGQVTLDAGAGFLTYTWSNGGASQTIPVSQNGNYEVTVSDASGCTGTAVFNANIPLQPSVAITGGPAFCSGGSSALTAAAGFQNYLWSDGTLIAETTVTQPGTYTVTATDANGCTSVAALAVVENALPQPQILGATTLCNGASTTLSVSANFPSLLWTTGETTPQITVSSAGTVGLQVTDANGCSGFASVEVIPGSLPSPQITAQPYTCNGQVTLDAGAGFLTYTWSNGGASQTIPVSQNGNYEVTVSDASGCTGTAVFNANIPTQPQVAIAGGPAFCTGSSSVLSAAAGFQSYLWSDGTLIAETTVTLPGSYTVTATDANGCTSVAALTVVENTLPQPQILGATTLCNGSSTTLSVSANFPSLLWSTGEITPQISVSSAGTIGLQVTDANGCSGFASVEVIAGSLPSPQITAQPYTCNGQLTLDAGAGFLTYTWSNGGASQTIPITQNGNYTVTVSDINGCTATGSLLAQVPPSLSVSISGNTALCPGDTAQLSVPPGFDNYSWSTGQTSNAISIATSGNYGVTVTDQFGCTAVDALTFDFSEAPDFEIIGDQLDCASAEAALGLDLLDVNGSPSILWSNGVTTATLVTTQPGVYSVTVTDANGCSETQTTEVLQQSIYASFADTLEFVPGQIVPLVPPTVGFQPVEIVWSPTDILVDCSNCPTAQARPTEDVLVSFKAVSEAGCVQEGTYFLFSKEQLRPAVYAPNAISPDSPLNPGFTLFGNELLVEIKYLRVFTRWGELVEELENIAPNNPSIGWNGSFRGQPVDPGVFVWVAEVVYQDGSTEVMQGDITVIR